jgi:hypothetical protein
MAGKTDRQLITRTFQSGNQSRSRFSKFIIVCRKTSILKQRTQIPSAGSFLTWRVDGIEGGYFFSEVDWFHGEGPYFGFRVTKIFSADGKLSEPLSGMPA